MGTLNLRSVIGVIAAAFIAFSPAVLAASANDTGLVSQIAAHLAQAKGVRARFTQTQTLSAMKQPLVSTGSLVFFRERGVIWQIDTPYKATYVIADAGVSEVNAHSERTNTKSGNVRAARAGRAHGSWM